MGDFANDALWSAMDAEDWRDNNRDSTNRLPHPLFDSGVFDYESLGNEIRYLDSLLDSNSLNLQIGNCYHFSDDTNIVGSPTKYLRKFQMMKGMVEYYWKNGYLSTKQKAWMETNWKGGSTSFERGWARPLTPEAVTAYKALIKIVQILESFK